MFPAGISSTFPHLLTLFSLSETALCPRMRPYTIISFFVDLFHLHTPACVSVISRRLERGLPPRHFSSGNSAYKASCWRPETRRLWAGCFSSAVSSSTSRRHGRHPKPRLQNIREKPSLKQSGTQKRQIHRKKTDFLSLVQK